MKLLANAIVVGGPIAVGKSTLVGALPFLSVQELDPNDELQLLLLEQMYEGDSIAPQVFQLDMLLTRFDKYKSLANRDTTTVFDRSIFEDYYFASKLLQGNKNVWEYYQAIWNDKVEELLKEVGRPKLYVLLTCNWKSFTERVFARNRHAEIENFQRNESYFKEMIEDYENFMRDMFVKYELDFVIIATDEKDKLTIIDEAKSILRKAGIL